jgi:integrase
MSSIKIVLRKDKIKDNLSQPLYLRVIIDQRAAYLSLKESILSRDWNEKKSEVKNSHLNYSRLNVKIKNLLAKAEEVKLDLERQHGKVSAKEVISHVSNKKNNDSFNYYANLHLEAIKAEGSMSRYRDEKPMLDVIKEYNNSRDIRFYEINKDYLLELRKFLFNRPRINSDRTVFNYLKLIKSIYEKAGRDGLVDLTRSPFKSLPKNKIRGKAKNEYKALELHELEKIIKLKLPPNSILWHTKNAWLLSYYIAGARIRDLVQFKWKNIVDGRLEYSMNKNTKFGAVKIAPQALEIIELYKDEAESNTDYILPVLKGKEIRSALDFERAVTNADRLYNKKLKIIAELAGLSNKLAMHDARHSFAYHAVSKGISVIEIQKLLRHSSVEKTMKYLANFIRKDSDDPIDQMFG